MRFSGFAKELGVLFQIVDDILDVTGSQETLGKQGGSDERLGKRTYVTEFGLTGARELAGESRRRALAALADATPDGGTELEQITDFIATRSF
jgi:geranylgeranyl diphosphate synthase type II